MIVNGYIPPQARAFGDAVTHRSIFHDHSALCQEACTRYDPALYFLTHLLGDSHKSHHGGKSPESPCTSGPLRLKSNNFAQAVGHVEGMSITFKSTWHGEHYVVYVRMILRDRLGLGTFMEVHMVCVGCLS